MILPPELLTLVFLTGLAAVYAQVEDTTTLTFITTWDVSSVITTPTAAPLSPTGDANSIGAPAPTPTADDPPQFTEVEACDLPDPPDWCNESPPDFWHPEESATGWDDWASWNNDGIGGGNDFAPTTPTLMPVEQTTQVVTTVTPTVIGIRTSVQAVVGGGATPQPQLPDTVPAGDWQTAKQEPPAQHTPAKDAPQTKTAGGPNASHGSQAQENPIQPTPGQSTAGSKPSPENLPAQGQSASTGNALLDTIISHLGNAQPGTQPAQPAQPTQHSLQTTGGSDEHFAQESAAAPTDTTHVGPRESAQGWDVGSGQITRAPANTASARDSIAVGTVITLGSAAISLTPGLSTVVGTGTDTTLIALQTDGASHTIITVSSSGTAVTATLSNAPATLTLPKTGFEASITDSAGRGVATSRAAVTAVSTSSRGVANDKRVDVSALSAFVVGLLGCAAVL